MEKVVIEITCERHPELGEIGREVGEVALKAVLRVWQQLGIITKTDVRVETPAHLLKADI